MPKHRNRSYARVCPSVQTGKALRAIVRRLSTDVLVAMYVNDKPFADPESFYPVSPSRALMVLRERFADEMGIGVGEVGNDHCSTLFRLRYGFGPFPATSYNLTPDVFDNLCREVMLGPSCPVTFSPPSSHLLALDQALTVYDESGPLLPLPSLDSFQLPWRQTLP